MDEQRFDNLTRVLGAATSRRQVLKGVVSIALGGALASLGLRGPTLGGAASAAPACDVAQCKASVEAHYLEEYQACSQDGSIAAGLCSLWFLRERHFNLQQCDRTGCFDGYCSNGVCCSYGEVNCSGTCVYLGNDPQNCGSCGNACPAGIDCVRGRCNCPNHEVACNGACVDITSDEQNCGRCGHTCDSGKVCFEGICRCPGGNVDCNGQCVDIYNDDQHCGSCNHACSNCEECSYGVCVPLELDPGYTCCNGRRVPLCADGSAPDPTTCTCNECQGQDDGTPCGDSQVCCGGSCCSSGESCCQGTCQDSSQACCDDPVQVCYGPNGPTGQCCPAGTGCHEWVDGSGNNSCCPLMGSDGPNPGAPYPALPGGICCSGSNYWAWECSSGWVCCDHERGLPTCCPQ